MNMRRALGWVILLCAAFAVFTACSGGGGGGKDATAEPKGEASTLPSPSPSEPGGQKAEAPKEEPRNEPVTLKINLDWDDASFEREWKIPVQEKFPYITLEKIPAAEINIEEQVAQGNIPDIIQARNHEHVSFLAQRGLTMDMSELIAKHGFDLDRLQRAMLQRAKNFGNGAIETLPFERGVHAMYYNKDIFDKFAVDYPTDDMTWSEVIALARKVTGEIDGVKYRGLDLDVPNMSFSQLGANYAHPETGDPMYTKDPAFQKYYDMMYEVWSIPGNLYGDDPASLIQSFGGKFVLEQNVAMVPLWNLTGWLATIEQESGMRWDMVTYPVWDDLPGVDPVAQGPVIGVSAASEHKDEAFQVIAFILSDEYQLRRSREGKPSVLASEAVNSEFAADNPQLAEKNLQAFFRHQPATGPAKYHEFEHIAENSSWDLMKEFARLSRDTNTHLRIVQEVAEARVENERKMR